MIITVPNGRGSYERGQRHRDFYLRICQLVVRLGRCVIKKGTNRDKKDNAIQEATLSDSEHVQFFNYNDIVEMFVSRGFELIDFSGSCLFSGIFVTNLIPEINFLMKINDWLGSAFPKLASGYYFYFRKKGRL